MQLSNVSRGALGETPASYIAEKPREKSPTATPRPVPAKARTDRHAKLSFATFASKGSSHTGLARFDRQLDAVLARLG